MSHTSLFLALPAEIRLQIYEHLLHPSAVPSASFSTSTKYLLIHDDHQLQAQTWDTFDPRTIYIRTIDPFLSRTLATTPSALRTRYSVRSGRFRACTVQTTYRALLGPYTAHLRESVPSLLLLNRQIHTEASKVLYSTYTFNFSTAIEAIPPFLSDLTPASRASVRKLDLTKRALPYTKEFDRCEWDATMEFLASPASGLNLQFLHLHIIAGKPSLASNPLLFPSEDFDVAGLDDWSEIRGVQAGELDVLLKARQEWGGEDGGVELGWLVQLLRIRGLKGVDVRAVVRPCPQPVSEGLAFWVAFSKMVVEGAFGRWLRGVMCEGCV